MCHTLSALVANAVVTPVASSLTHSVSPRCIRVLVWVRGSVGLTTSLPSVFYKVTALAGFIQALFAALVFILIRLV